MIGISQRRESLCRINTSVRTKKSIQKNRFVTVIVRDPSRKVNYLSENMWLKYPKANLLAGGLLEKTSCILDENISKNLQIFLEVNPVQKEVLPLHKLQDHAYE